MEQLGRLYINFGWGWGSGGRVRHCLACEVSGAPAVSLVCAWRCVSWSVRGFPCVCGVCMSVSVWVLARLSLCVSGSVPGVCVSEPLASLGLGSSIECVPLWGSWGFVSRCLNPGLSAGGSGPTWILSVCVIV